MIALAIPFPPSVNRLYRTFRGRMIMSKVGRDWYAKALPSVQRQMEAHHTIGRRVRVSIQVYPPDDRRRDLDNLCKTTLDVLTKAGVYADDSHIDDLRLVRFAKEKGGRLVAFVEEIE